MYETLYIEDEFILGNMISHNKFDEALRRLHDLKLCEFEPNKKFIGNFLLKYDGQTLFESKQDEIYFKNHGSAIFVNPFDDKIIDIVYEDMNLFPFPLKKWNCKIIENPNYIDLLEKGDIYNEISIDTLKKRVIKKIRQYTVDILENITLDHGVVININKIKYKDIESLTEEMWKYIYQFVYDVEKAEIEEINNINNMDNAEEVYKSYIDGPWHLIALSSKNRDIYLPRR